MPVSTAANSGTFTLVPSSDREVTITRLFAAPRDLVFDAMTKPEHIVRWWGMLGEGYSVPVCEVDLRVGGRWKFVNAFRRGSARSTASIGRSCVRIGSSSPKSSSPIPTVDPS